MASVRLIPDSPVARALGLPAVAPVSNPCPACGRAASYIGSVAGEVLLGQIKVWIDHVDPSTGEVNGEYPIMVPRWGEGRIHDACLASLTGKYHPTITDGKGRSLAFIRNLVHDPAHTSEYASKVRQPEVHPVPSTSYQRQWTKVLKLCAEKAKGDQTRSISTRVALTAEVPSELSMILRSDTPQPKHRNAVLKVTHVRRPIVLPKPDHTIHRGGAERWYWSTTRNRIRSYPFTGREGDSYVEKDIRRVDC